MTLRSFGRLQIDDNGKPIGWQPTHISTNATTVVKATPGILHSIAINTKGSSSNVMTVYNDPATSNNPIAIIDTTANVGTVFFDAVMSNGITLITSTGTAGDFTVNFI